MRKSFFFFLLWWGVSFLQAFNVTGEESGDDADLFSDIGIDLEAPSAGHGSMPTSHFSASSSSISDVDSSSSLSSSEPFPQTVLPMSSTPSEPRTYPSKYMLSDSYSGHFQKQVPFSYDRKADADIRRTLNKMKEQYKNYHITYVDQQLANDAGLSKNNPVHFNIHKGIASTLAEEVALSTAYAVFFCSGAPEDTWVAFKTVVNKGSGTLRRLGFGLLGAADDIRPLITTVTVDCGNIFNTICLKTACQGGLCGFPLFRNLAAVCGYCRGNPEYEVRTRSCQRDYIDAFITKVGAHEYQKAQRAYPWRDKSYYQYGRVAAISPFAPANPSFAPQQSLPTYYPPTYPTPYAPSYVPSTVPTYPMTWQQPARAIALPPYSGYPFPYRQRYNGYPFPYRQRYNGYPPMPL